MQYFFVIKVEWFLYFALLFNLALHLHGQQPICIVSDTIKFENSKEVNELLPLIDRVEFKNIDTLIFIIPFSRPPFEYVLQSRPLYFSLQKKIIRQIQFINAPHRFIKGGRRPWFADGVVNPPNQDILIWYNKKEILVTNKQFEYKSHKKLPKEMGFYPLFMPWIPGKDQIQIPMDYLGAPEDSVRFLEIKYSEILSKQGKIEWNKMMAKKEAQFSADKCFALCNRKYTSDTSGDVIYYPSADGRNIVEYSRLNYPTKALIPDIPIFNGLELRKCSALPVGRCQLQDIEIFKNETKVAGIRYEYFNYNSLTKIWIRVLRVQPENEEMREFLRQCLFNCPISKPNENTDEFYIVQYFESDVFNSSIVLSYLPEPIKLQREQIHFLYTKDKGSNLKIIMLNLSK